MANAGGAADIVSASGRGHDGRPIAWPAGARGGRRMISVPRWLLLALGAAVLDLPRGPRHLLARRRRARRGRRSSRSCSTRSRRSLSLWPAKRVRMPDWLAAFDLAVSIVLPLLVTSQLDPTRDNGYATWYVAAVGTLMTIAAARRQLRRGVARRHRPRRADRPLGRSVRARRPRRDRQHRVGRHRAHADERAREGGSRDPALRAGRARGGGVAGGPGRAPLRGPDAARADEPHRRADAPTHRRPRRRPDRRRSGASAACSRPRSATRSAGGCC